MIVGYTYVVGDILHFGHIQYLKSCRALCDKLIVGVLTDKAVMEKKPEPAMGFKERLELVGELKSVDAVVAQEQYWPKKNINNIKPDIVFESSSHKERYPNMYGRTIVLPYFPDQSSTKIKEKIHGK